MSHFPQRDPPSEEGLLLRRLLDHDPAAPAELAAAYLNDLCLWLEAKYPRVDPHHRQTAANNALLDLIKNPQGYDPARLDLTRYLRMAAKRDLWNLRRDERRHDRSRVPWNVVADYDIAGNHWRREGDPTLPLEVAEEREARDARVEALTRGWTPEERRVQELLEDGVNRTEDIAPEIGLGHLPPHEQEKAVKRIRDRVNARRKRAGGEHE